MKRKKTFNLLYREIWPLDLYVSRGSWEECMHVSRPPRDLHLTSVDLLQSRFSPSWRHQIRHPGKNKSINIHVVQSVNLSLTICPITYEYEYRELSISQSSKWNHWYLKIYFLVPKYHFEITTVWGKGGEVKKEFLKCEQTIFFDTVEL